MTGQPSTQKLSSRLFAAIFFASLLICVSAAAAVVAASWSVHEGDAEERLASQAEQGASRLAGLSEEDMIAEISSLTLADTRVTLISNDGTVLFDTFADASSMPNHGSREEVLSAKSGVGSAILRRSETMGTDTLYAASMVDDRGIVVRLSESRTSLAYYLGSLSLPLLGIVLFSVALSAVISRLLTRRISAPLLAIDLEKPLESSTYVEIEPLLSRIDIQREELLEQNRQLQQSVALRREFTANVSHEMKSPLQIIGGYAELIESGIASPEDTRRFAGLIRTESQSMRTLIDDVLILARLDESDAIAHDPCNLSNVCERVINRCSLPAKDEGMALRPHIQRDIFVRGSDSLAEQLVFNLVDNAIRHGRKNGTVELSLSSLHGTAQLSVSDDGPGIPAEARERVFERFYRIDPSRSKNTGGTGLGLAIVKHAAESMNGSVSLDESPAGGCVFTVVLPVC